MKKKDEKRLNKTKYDHKSRLRGINNIKIIIKTKISTNFRSFLLHLNEIPWRCSTNRMNQYRIFLSWVLFCRLSSELHHKHRVLRQKNNSWLLFFFILFMPLSVAYTSLLMTDRQRNKTSFFSLFLIPLALLICYDPSCSRLRSMHCD